MYLPTIQEGDILLYYRGGGFTEPFIKVGEILEDGLQAQEFYHVAIALDSKTKIETNGFEPVRVTNIIMDGSFDVFRPPIDREHRLDGLHAVVQLEGQHYDWMLILDEALRSLTHNMIHLPENWIQSYERRRKICSTLVAFYLQAAKWGHLKTRPRPTPEDIWLVVQDYPVEG